MALSDTAVRQAKPVRKDYTIEPESTKGSNTKLASSLARRYRYCAKAGGAQVVHSHSRRWPYRGVQGFPAFQR